MTIGDKIKQLRTERQWSQEQVARMLGYKSRSTVNKIELGINELTQSKIVAFANLFGVEPWQLLNDEPLNIDEIKSQWARSDKERIIQAELKVYEDVQSLFGKEAGDSFFVEFSRNSSTRLRFQRPVRASVCASSFRR